MADSTQMVSDFTRYASIVRAHLASASEFVAEAESATAVQVERGLVFPVTLLNASHADWSAVDRLVELSIHPRLASIAVVDRGGHNRPMYRGLLVYSWLRAFGLVYETLPAGEFGKWENGLRSWCDLLESELGETDTPGGVISAGHGSTATESAWMALALHAAGRILVRDVWTDLAADTFGKLVGAQADCGAFLRATAADGPETHWYHELVLLHAAASFAVQAQDHTIAAAVARNALWQQNETQPDHATTQPWALFAYVSNPQTRPLADALLHAATVQPSGVSLMLLADAVYCLELFTKGQ